RFKPKLETFIRIHPQFEKDEALKPLFDELETKAKKQLDLLMAYIHICHSSGKGYKEIPRSDLLEKSKSGNAALNSLLKKNILLQEKREIGRMNEDENELTSFILT